ncbi:MAG: tripartite tricarboxylate transporter TctB family protein [Methyloligellaceae bacterium]
MSQENRIHLIAGLVLLAFGVLGVAVLIPLGVDEPGKLQFAALSPSYWPRIICIALALLGAGIVASILLKARSGEADDGDGDTEVDAAEATPLRALAAIVLLFVLYLVLEPLGFVLAGALALAAYMVLAGERRATIIGPVAVGVPLVLYLFFTKAAQVPIPAGILESILVG